MKQNLHKLAVIIPCWNVERLLPKMLNCLVAQSFQDWNLFCVDDLSTDSTADIIRSYGDKDSRVHYVRRNREPKGAQTCRNIGFDLTNDSKYVMFLDADDLIAPYCFEQRVRYMEEHPEVEGASFPAISFTEKIYEGNGPVFGRKLLEDDLQSMLNQCLPFTVWTDIFRREALTRNGLHWDERIKSWQDSDFNIQMLLSGLRHTFADGAQVDYFYRVAGVGKSIAGKIKTKAHFDSHLYLLDKVTKTVSEKHGSKYDFYLESYLVNFFGIFGHDYSTYKRILRFDWVKKRPLFKLKIVLYMMIYMKDRRIIFYKNRKYSKRISALCRAKYAKWNKEFVQYVNPEIEILSQ